MRNARCPAPERGAVALTLTWLLLFATLLAGAYMQRGVLVEQQASANQYRAAQAHAAAEAGIDWALAQLNDSGRRGGNCRPSVDAGAMTFRERYLHHDPATATYSGASWDDGGVARPLAPGCMRGAGGWVCSCPSGGPPALATDPAAPGFTLQLQGDPQPAIVRLVSTGCSAQPCTAGAANADARVRIEAALALLPALRSAPAAALTVRGNIEADTAAFGAHNHDPLSGGTALHAGGAIHASRARLTAPAGAVSAGRIVGHDASLAALDGERYFANWFGLDPTLWMRQTMVQPLRCSADCAAALGRAIDAGAALIAVDGELPIAGPVTLGSPERPVVIVATGAARLRGAVALTGVLYAAELVWNDAGAGAWLRGAAISAGDYRGNGNPDLIYDPGVLARLTRSVGSFVRVPGSWHDF